MARIIQQILAALCVFIALVSAYSAPTFCKCSCFSNSTIIPLGPHHPTDGGAQPPPASDKRDTAAAAAVDVFSSPASAPLAPRGSSSSCSQCNRAFCLDYNLPICKGAEEKDVVAMCFQRDSRKDQIIVWGFLLGTGSLLGWTAVQHYLKSREERAAAAAAAAGNNRAPLLGGGRGGIDGQENIFQRLAARVGLGGQSGAGRSRSPRSAPTAAIPRGQYSPLDGNSRD
ncbi:MAG: hypothetical protein STHCBS139747_007261 [Sporothrix thermara]